MYLSFFRIPLILFGCIGVHPGEQYTAKQIFLYFIIFISQWSIVYLAILHLSYKESITIPDLTTAFETLFLIFHASMKLSMLFIKKSKFEDLLERTNHFWKIEDLENEIEKEEYKKYLTFIKTLSTMYNALSVTTSAAFTLKPFLVKGGYLTFTTYKPDWIPFYVMAFYQDMVFIFGVYAPAVGIDLFALVLLLLVKMQFKMLNREMGRVFQGTPKSKEYLEDNILYKRIKKTVDYHNFLLEIIEYFWNNLGNMYLSFLRIPLIMFGCIGVHPEEGYTFRQIFIYFTIFISQWSIFYLTILHLSYKETMTISDLTSAFETLFLMFHASMKLTMLFIKKRTFHDLLERINQFWKIEDLENETEKDEHKQYLTLIKTLSSMYNALSVATSAAFTLKPFLTKGGYLTFTTYRPDWIPFYVMAFYQDVVCIFGIYGPIVGMDLFVLVLLLLVKMQLKMLNQEMGRMFQETPKSEENLGDNILHKRIKKIVDYHNFLLDYVNRINNLISEGMLVYVIIIVLSMCVEMYIVSTQKSVTAAVKVVLYMTNGLLQYSICYCIPAQAVTDEAERTVNYVYFNKWYEHPVSSVKVTQTMILARAQQKTLILAGGYVKINLETCLATLKTMVSYAMFIRTMGIAEN